MALWEDYLRQYALVVLFTGVAVVLPTSMLVMSWMASFMGIRPHRPTPIKQDLYECGMEVIGGRWLAFNIRYYLYALLFVVFDVEIVFLYPWAVRLPSLGVSALVEMFLFLLVLAVGWVYAWRKRALEWR